MVDRITCLWLEGPLGPIQELSLRSILAQDYRVDLFSYDMAALPNWPGVTLRDARHILPEPIYTYQAPAAHVGNPVLHVNLWRYSFLYEFGGCVVELDQVLLDRLPGGRYVSSEWCGRDAHPNLAVLNLPAGADVMARCLKRSRERLPVAIKGQFGPKLLAEQLDDKTDVLHPDMFCPLRYSQVGNLFTLAAWKLPARAIGVHLWAGMFRRQGFDPSQAQPSCLWSQLWERFCQ